ncbi:MAG TPA: hypothetical protein VH393_08300 [Ktedonobacterales bacterium]
MKTQRPATLNIAIILLILASLVFWLATFLPGADRDPGPPIVLYASVLLGMLGLVSVFGALFGAGGMVYSSDAITKGLGALTVALYALVIVLMALPFERQMYRA